MTRHTRSIFFTIITSICNIIITLVIVGGSFFLVSYLAYNFGLLKEGSSNMLYMALIAIVFFFGLIASLKVYMIFARWVIRVFKLDGKLDQKILDHYSPDNEKTL